MLRLPPKQAEMINLKAQFLAALGDDDAAHATFSEALTLFTLCAEAWVAWGRFCDGMYQKTPGASQWLDFAGSCFIQVGSGFFLLKFEIWGVPLAHLRQTSGWTLPGRASFRWAACVGDGGGVGGWVSCVDACARACVRTGAPAWRGGEGSAVPNAIH